MAERIRGRYLKSEALDMNSDFINILKCPPDGQALQLQDDGSLVTLDGKHHYAVSNNIPRFVPKSNCADNFGMQWNPFRETHFNSSCAILDLFVTTTGISSYAI